MADGDGIDLSAGLVPKAATAPPPTSPDNIDLSAGLVPKTPTGVNTKGQPDALSRAWDWANRGYVSPDDVAKTFTGVGVQDLRDWANEAHPEYSHARNVTRSFLGHMAATAAQHLSSMSSSPIGITTMGLGPLAEGVAEGLQLPKTLQALRTVDLGANAAFGGQGLHQTYEAATDPTEQSWAERGSNIAGGLGQAVMGAAGAGSRYQGSYLPEVTQAAQRGGQAVGRGATEVGKTMGVGYTPEEMITKAGGPSVQGQEGANLPRNLRIAGPRLVEQNQIRKIKTVQDMADGAYMASRRVYEDGYGAQIARHPNATFDATPIGAEIRGGVNQATRYLFPAEGRAADEFADKFNGPITLENANEYLKALNGKLRGYYKLSPAERHAAGITDGSISAWESAAEGLRSRIDDTLEARGEQDPQGLRQEYGALTSIQRIFEKRAVTSGRQKLFDLSQLGSLGLGALEAGGAVLAGHPLGAVLGALPLAATSTAKYLNSSDVMVRRGIRGLEKTAGPARPLTPGGAPPPTPPPTGGGPAPGGGGPRGLPPAPPGTPGAGSWAQAQWVHQMPPSPLGPVMQPVAGQLGRGAQPPVTTSPSRMLPPAMLPQSILHPTPGFEAPLAPSPSAEQAAIERATAQGRGPTPVGETAPAPTGTQAAGTVGTEQAAQRDTGLFKQAQRENPNGTVRDWLNRAQELKQQEQQPLFSPAPASGGAMGEVSTADRVQQATDNLNSLRMQLDRQEAAGDTAAFQTRSKVRDAEDELQSATEAHAVNQNIGELFAGKGKQSPTAKRHATAVASMLLDATAPPQTADWNVIRPGKGLPNAINLNDTARKLIGNALGTPFGGISMSPYTLDEEVLPRLEMAAQAIDNTRAQRPDYFDPQASTKVRQLAQAIQDNRGPEGISLTRSEGTPEQQRYTQHEELFHTAVQRRPAAGGGGYGGLAVPDLGGDPGMEKMRPRIVKETGRLTSIVHHAEGMADIMQGRAPELTPEEAGNTAENYWDQLAARGKQGVQGLVDAFKLENFTDDDEARRGYTPDEATRAIRTAGRNALARVLARAYSENLRGLARAVQSEPAAANVAGTQGSAVAAGNVPPAGRTANLGPPSEAAASIEASPISAGVEPSAQGSLFSPDTEGNLRRALKREEGVGNPKQDKAIELTRDDGKPFYVGRMTTAQWVDKVNSYLKPDELTEWRNWYRDVRQHFVENSGGDEQLADRRMMGWLLTQQRASPAVGYQNLSRAEDIASGLPEIKQPGLGAEKIYAALRGETPEAGLGAKLHDFVDSARGKATRTWMGDDPRGGGPAVIDVHGARDSGYVDEPMLNEIENQFGSKVAKRFKVDMKGAPNETQYENGSQYYNDLVKQLNKRNFDGGGWRPEEVQAVGWAAQQRMTNRVPQLVKDIFEPSRRTVSSELAFGEGSPYAKEFGKQWNALPYEKQQAITQQVMNKIVEIASRESGGKVIQALSGPGGYQEFPISASVQHVIEGSPEAAQRLANIIGYLGQQTEVMVSRPLLSGDKSAFQILEKGAEGFFRSPQQAASFWNDFRNTMRQQAPRVAAKLQGFMPVKVNGQTGIRMVTGKGKFNDADMQQLQRVADEVSERASIDTENKGFEGYVSEGTGHDWTKDKTGRQYTSRLGQTGRPGIQGRLASASAEVRAEIQRAFQNHAPEAGVAPPQPSRTPPPVVPLFLRPRGPRAP
jgi:hypothetical protein